MLFKHFFPTLALNSGLRELREKNVWRVPVILFDIEELFLYVYLLPGKFGVATPNRAFMFVGLKGTNRFQPLGQTCPTDIMLQYISRSPYEGKKKKKKKPSSYENE